MKLLAIDIGASGGRAIEGDFSGGRLDLREIYRFPNNFVDVAGHKHWNILQLFEEVKESLSIAGPEIVCAGIDTWGVDYGYVGKDGDLLGLPFSYRDAQRAAAAEEVHRKIPFEELYSITGIQFLSFNTVYQIADDLARRPWIVDKADKMLMMPELIGYLLTGEKVSEYTIASTTGLLDAVKGRWSKYILPKLGFPVDRLPGIVMPGKFKAAMSPAVQRETGSKADIVYPACHDTACAVAAVPAEGEDWAYISSGTWSLIGMELSEPFLSDDARLANFTNEGGVFGSVRFLKNVMGLWPVQEIQRLLAREGEVLTFDAINHEASKAPPFQSFINPDHPSFMAPVDMRKAIAQYCDKTEQRLPDSIGRMVRCVFESLALKYRLTLEKLEEITGRKAQRIHVVGGGSRNAMLNQMTADACNLPLTAGPAEATAVGNLVVQAASNAFIGSISEGRSIVRASFPLEEYEPSNPAPWEQAATRFKILP